MSREKRDLGDLGGGLRVAPMSQRSYHAQPLQSKDILHPDNIMAAAAGKLEGAWRAFENIDIAALETVVGPLPACHRAQTAKISASTVTAEQAAALLPAGAELGAAAVTMPLLIDQVAQQRVGGGFGHLGRYLGRFAILDARLRLEDAVSKLGKLVEASMIAVLTRVRSKYEQEVAKHMAEAGRQQFKDAVEKLQHLDTKGVKGTAELKAKFDAEFHQHFASGNERNKKLLAPLNQEYRHQIDAVAAPFYAVLKNYAVHESEAR